MKKFKMNIERDDLRMIQQNFFPYIGQLLHTRIKNHHAQQPIAEQLQDKLLLSVFLDAKMIVDKRLIGEANTFTIRFSDAQVIALNVLLNQVPIANTQVYMQVLRQKFCDQLYRWINEPH